MISEKDITIRPDSMARPGPPIFSTNSCEFVHALARSPGSNHELGHYGRWRDVVGIVVIPTIAPRSAVVRNGFDLSSALHRVASLSIQSRRKIKTIANN